ncbi:MAG: DUF2788 domain-containing protein [Ideonella sp.]|jgi:hypothetical protein|nr:DUF2788 domain-containing protein [Ideonella sp.]
MTITDEQLSTWGLTIGLTLFIGYMLFIVWDLARRSKAGRLGTFVLFFVLAFGMFGFMMKSVIQWILGL